MVPVVVRSKERAKPYGGILAEPMPRFTALTGPDDQEVSGLIDAKMKALLAHFNIDPADAFEPGPRMASTWADLAWRLAREHVPGFRPQPRGRGKPPTRKGDDVTLVMHVELLRRRDGLSDRAAIKRISEEHLVTGKEATLLKRYKDAKRVFAPMSTMFNNIVSVKGNDVFVQILRESLFGGEKDSFSSPP